MDAYLQEARDKILGQSCILILVYPEVLHDMCTLLPVI